jgi:hypothetical protein
MAHIIFPWRWTNLKIMSSVQITCTCAPIDFLCVDVSFYYFASVRVCVGRKRARPYGNARPHRSLKSCKWAAQHSTQVHAPYDRHLLNAARGSSSGGGGGDLWRACNDAIVECWLTAFMHTLCSCCGVVITIAHTTKQARAALVMATE